MPFIARYRQQQTGGLEPPALRRLEDALKAYKWWEDELPEGVNCYE